MWQLDQRRRPQVLPPRRLHLPPGRRSGARNVEGRRLDVSPVRLPLDFCFSTKISRSRGDERGYEQFGALRGHVRGDSFAEDLLLNLPSCRTRFWGTADKLAVQRSVHLFVAGKDGALISVWAKALKHGCRE
jgi:hypothetical protein